MNVDFSAPLDTRAWFSRIPQGRTSFARALTAVASRLGPVAEDEVRARGLSPTRRTLVSELLDTWCAIGRKLYPDKPLRESLRRMAWQLYPVLRNSRVGRHSLALFEDDTLALMTSFIRVLDDFVAVRFDVVERTPDSLTLSYREFDSDRSMDVGLFEGVLVATGAHADVGVHEVDDRSGFLRISTR